MKLKYLILWLALAGGLLLAGGPVGRSGVGGAAAEALPIPRVQSDAGYLYHHQFFNNKHGYISTLYLQNTGAADATVALSFRELPSGETYTDSQIIPSGGSAALPADGLAQLPEAACYSVVVSSDQPLESVVRTDHSVASGDKVAAYRGASSGSTVLHFGPYHKNWPIDSGSLNSEVILWNIGSSVASVVVDFLSADGWLEGTQLADVAADQQWSLYAASQDGLPDGFRGWVMVTADQPIVGWLHQGDGAGEVFQIQGPLEENAQGGTLVYRSSLPRVLKRVDEGNGSRTTHLIVGNAASSQAQVQLDYLAGDGTVIYSSPLSLPAAGATVIDIGKEGSLADPGIWGLILSADQPVLLEEVYYDESARVSVGTYKGHSDTSLALPRLARTERGHTVFSLQNLGSSAGDVTVQYFDTSGVLLYSEATTLPAGGWVRYDQSEMSELGEDFEGSAIIQSTSALMAEVDEYAYEACEAVSNVEIGRTPTGDLFTGNTVRFTASATGTLPFSYTWTLDGKPVGADQSTLDRTFSAAGTYAVGVEVANDCGQGGDTMVVDIQEPAAVLPDLTESHKSAGLTNVEAGDLLTYTFLLRNTSAMTASAVLTDPIPSYTSYVTDSAEASDGSEVTMADGQLHWAGEIISGTPVVVEFAVDVGSASVGTPITNTARLDDGLDNVISLETGSVYNPGYRLTINDGALFTAMPTVTLGLSWGAEDPPIDQMQISNDGGFGSGTGWIAASSTHSGWTLDTYGDLRLPRTVYALFRDEEGKPYGPIQDDIIYDPNPPQLTQVEIITQTATQGFEIRAAHQVIVRVTASDDSSGVEAVQISDSASFGTFSEFEVTGSTTDIPWTLQPSGEVYVRVVDRAGNVSEAEKGQGPTTYEIYVPLVLRHK